MKTKETLKAKTKAKTKQTPTTKRDEHSFTKRAKVSASSIMQYNLQLANYRVAMKKSHEHFIPLLYGLLRKYMPVKQARDRLHTDIVETSQLIGERAFLLHLPDEAKNMMLSHKKTKKTIQTLADGQTMEVPDTDTDSTSTENVAVFGDIDEDGEDGAGEWRSIRGSGGANAADDSTDDSDSSIPVTTEREFLDSFKGINPHDSSFGVGIRTVNFSIPNLSEAQNNLGQKILHEAFKDQLVLYIKSEGFSFELSRAIHKKLKLSLVDIPLINLYTDMAASLSSSVLSWDKTQTKK